MDKTHRQLTGVRGLREARNGRAALLLWLDADLKKWVQKQASKSYRGNQTLFVERLIQEAKDRK